VLACRDHLVTGEMFDVVECRGCGLRMTDPRPDARAIGRYYESDAYLPMSNAGGGALATTYRAVRRLTVRLRLGLVVRHASHAPGRLLDVGCGTGEFLAHARACGWDVAGVEPAARAADQAEGHRVAVHRTMDLSTVADGPFDAITLWHALEHMHDPVAQLAQVRRLLAPGGCVVVAVPNHESVDAVAYGADWYAWDVPRHLWHFTPVTLGRLLAHAGFAPGEPHALPFDPYYISLSSERRGRRTWNLLRAATIATRSSMAAWRMPARASAIAVAARPIGATA
jgi:SAM-dependent methyltransferase